MLGFLCRFLFEDNALAADLVRLHKYFVAFLDSDN